MEQAYKLGLSDAEIKYVNYCRLFLDVISLADISDEDGNYIVNEAWIRRKAIKLSRRKTPICNQELPSSPSWSTWKKVIQQFTISNRRKLTHKLGEWKVESSQIRARYKHYRTADILYTTVEDKITKSPIV